MATVIISRIVNGAGKARRTSSALWNSVRTLKTTDCRHAPSGGYGAGVELGDIW
jgi:hypothetical protein